MKRVAISYSAAYDPARNKNVGTLQVSTDAGLSVVSVNIPDSGEIDEATFAVMLRQMSSIIAPGLVSDIAAALEADAVAKAQAAADAANAETPAPDPVPVVEPPPPTPVPPSEEPDV